LERWQDKALELFPDVPKLSDVLGSAAPGPLGVCNELYLALIDSYVTKPFNDDRIGRIYDFAAWCFRQPQTHDASTDLSNAVAVGLIENLPLDQRVASDLYRWVSTETFEGCERLFQYHLSEEEYHKFLADFLNKKKQFSGSPRL
jgi:hypothetical protein